MTVEEFKKLKSGDKVKLKNCKGRIWVREMDKFIGATVTIHTITAQHLYFTVIDGDYEWSFEINDIESVVADEVVIEKKAVRKPDGSTSGAGTYVDSLNKEMDSLYEELRKQSVEGYVNAKKVEIYEQFFNDLAALAQATTERLRNISRPD